MALMRGNSSLESHIRRKSEGKANHSLSRLSWRWKDEGHEQKRYNGVEMEMAKGEWREGREARIAYLKRKREKEKWKEKVGHMSSFGWACIHIGLNESESNFEQKSSTL